ncbi:MAG: hypothetical protein LBV16_03580 [Elusimicrobiota bacterium]|nr:hypothetical protein [Elusimicrobiota bacterium]
MLNFDYGSQIVKNDKLYGGGGVVTIKEKPAFVLDKSKLRVVVKITIVRSIKFLPFCLDWQVYIKTTALMSIKRLYARNLTFTQTISVSAQYLYSYILYISVMQEV